MYASPQVGDASTAASTARFYPARSLANHRAGKHPPATGLENMQFPGQRRRTTATMSG